MHSMLIRIHGLVHHFATKMHYPHPLLRSINQCLRFFFFLILNLSVILGYKCSDDKDRVEDVVLEGEQGQAHVGKDEVLS